MNICPAEPQDIPAIASIIMPTIRAGTTYTLDPSLSETKALAYWLAADKETFVAKVDGVVLGTYYIRANQGGGGSHVCNCGYMTSQHAIGKGVGRHMCEHSLLYAKTKGFLAMQFNFVVSTNESAIYLWQSLGFDIVGRLPSAFDHPSAGFVDALVFYKHLT